VIDLTLVLLFFFQNYEIFSLTELEDFRFSSNEKASIDCASDLFPRDSSIGDASQFDEKRSPESCAKISDENNLRIFSMLTHFRHHYVYLLVAYLPLHFNIFVAGDIRRAGGHFLRSESVNGGFGSVKATYQAVRLILKRVSTTSLLCKM